MDPQFFIYALTDPDKGRRYIGQSSTGMRRPKQHARASYLKKDAHFHSTRWIQTLLEQGLMYGIEILEVTDETKEALDAAEIRWIAYGRAQGWQLTNHTEGGGGRRGFKHSAEARAKMSVAHTGKKKPRSVEHQAKLNATQVGRTRSNETRAKLRAAWLRRAPDSAVTRAKKSAALRRRGSPSAATRAKISANNVGKNVRTRPVQG